MLLIPCPYCGERDESEFHNGGEAHIQRPRQPQALSDPEWADYLFMRTNPKGVFHERWLHSHGCGRWFNAARDTVSDRFLAVYRMGEQPPKIEPPAERPAGGGRKLEVVTPEQDAKA